MVRLKVRVLGSGWSWGQDGPGVRVNLGLGGFWGWGGSGVRVNLGLGWFWCWSDSSVGWIVGFGWFWCWGGSSVGGIVGAVTLLPLLCFSCSCRAGGAAAVAEADAWLLDGPAEPERHPAGSDAAAEGNIKGIRMAGAGRQHGIVLFFKISWPWRQEEFVQQCPV